MKSNWKTKKLGDVCCVGAGNSAPQKKELFKNGTHLFIRTSDVGRIRFGNIEDSLDKLNEEGIRKLRLIKKGTVLFPKSGASTFLNHRVLMNKDGFVSSHLATLKAKDNILDDRFLLYFTSRIDARDLMQDQNYPSLRLSDIQEIDIFVPPLEEQRQIVKLVEKVFENAEKAKKNVEKNLQNARELFESYLQNIFANPGDGWEDKKLGEVCVLRSGTTLSPSIEKSEGDLPYLKVADMNLEKNVGSIEVSSRFVNLHDVNANGIIPIGSTIFPKRGGAILTNKKRITSVKICMDLNLMAVTPKEEILPGFLHFYFLGLDLRKINSGSSIPQINNYQIEPLKICFPKLLKKQKIIVGKLDNLLAETKKLEAIYQQKLADLEELKKSVLQKAFKGELTEALV